MSLDLNNLKSNRDEILKIEVVSLLFLIEKTFLSWWKNNGYYSSEIPLYTNSRNEIKNLLEDSLKNIKIDDISTLMTNYTQSQKDINLWQYFFKDWRKWRGNNPHKITSQLKILQKLYGSAEGLNSGIEKGNPKENMQGDTPWISNSFGSFKFKCKVDFFDKKRDEIKDKIKSYLYKLAVGSFDFENDRRDFFELIKSLYGHIPSDTRFPLNDVTLWEQAYMATSMFKSLLAGIYLKPIDTNSFDLSDVKWNILVIQYDKLSLAEKGLKPAHIVWYREACKSVDKAIKKIIEVVCPIGNEIYKDETGVYFLVSENIKTEDIQEVTNKILETFQIEFKDEIYPYIGLAKSSRGIMNLTYLLEESKKNFLKADYSIKNITLSNAPNIIGICQVCKDRFAINNEDDIPMCNVCKERKNNRLSNWLSNQSSETIWIDEIDESSIALITLKFELKEWLNGKLMSSLIAQKIDLDNHNILDYINDIYIALKDDKNLDETTLVKDYTENINPKNRPLREISKTWFLERSIGDKWEKFIKANLSDENLINFENRRIDWQNLTDNDFEFLSTLILQFILRKNPSPARLRRVWESTEEFFEEVKREILDTYTEQRTQESFSSKVTDFASLQVQDTIYKQYFSITDISPISWQFVIPTSKIEDFIEKVKKLYYKHFKYVNCKLPLHIGIVVQNSKFPLYIGIKAIRNIRRDIKEWSEIKKEGKKLLEDLSCYEEVIEQSNNSKDYYSLYETPNNPTYPFKRLPSNTGVKLYNENDEFIIYPNTIDFEYLDTNTRRNDIYYEKGKRVVDLKKNRPIEWSEWENYKNFKEMFKDKPNQLQTIVSLIYSKMEDWKDNENSFKLFMQTTFKRYEVDISKLGIKDFSFDEMKKFIDMFEFWHTALKEI